MYVFFFKLVFYAFWCLQNYFMWTSFRGLWPNTDWYLSTWGKKISWLYSWCNVVSAAVMSCCTHQVKQKWSESAHLCWLTQIITSIHTLVTRVRDRNMERDTNKRDIHSPLVNVTHFALCPERRDRRLNGCRSEYICWKGNWKAPLDVKHSKWKTHKVQEDKADFFFLLINQQEIFFFFMSVNGPFLFSLFSFCLIFFFTRIPHNRSDSVWGFISAFFMVAKTGRSIMG